MRRFTVLVRAAVGVGVFGLPYLSHPPLPSPLRSDCPGAPRVDCWQLLLLFLPEYRRCPPSPARPVTDCCDWQTRKATWGAATGLNLAARSRRWSSGRQAGRQASCCRCCCGKDTFLVSNGLPACRSSHHCQHRHQRKYMCEQAKKPEATRALMPLDDSGVVRTWANTWLFH